MSGQSERGLVLRDYGHVLQVSEWQGGVLVPIMQIIAGKVTQVQLAYFEANVKGRIKQVEADLILKYFYGL